MKKNKWLAISIFSPKNNWPSLLKNGISPLIDLLWNNNEIISFHLRFKDLNSEHIRLSLLVPSNLTYKVAKKTEIYFKGLFKENELSTASKNGPLKGMFVPYSEYTVHYDLYSTSMLPNGGDLLTLQEALSWSMLGAFSEDVIDDDLILTFCIYILFNCYKMLPASGRLLYAKDQLTRHVVEAGYDIIENEYNDLRSSIHDIYNSVMDPLPEKTVVWLNKWENAFKKTYTAACHNRQESTCFDQAVNLIYQQFKLSKFSIVLLNSFILKTLSEQISQSIHKD